MALETKGGGIRPIAAGYTCRRLVAKCANRHVISRRSTTLQLIHLGVGVAGEAEAAIHATRRYAKQLPDNHVIVKLDFNNAFNSVRRDLVLDLMADKTPEFCRFVYASSSRDPILTFVNQQIGSREGFQQGDPLTSLAFCDTVHPQSRLFSSSRFHG